MEGSVGKGEEKVWRVGEKKFVRLCVRAREGKERAVRKGKKKC
jgi:hypothetical protein